ncbi:Ger(x)C family spore germination protein [Rossellomorea aquimaris]|uniref:Ger(x)C family spore germination protein n=1 Tax=Rossellomorea aquimaris TaxID=189382 RepID=UPI001CD3057C|nr:Ger(x)C family spore germination protein [Rossellomorea aquimaris]MCA1061203.1 Ger(x)C family spore germination protein [Rossellomorea aquimaris]
MKLRFLFISILISSMLLTGCVEREILDDLYIETAKAFDYEGEDKIRGTSLFPIYLADKSIQNGTLSAEASSTREVLEKLERRSQQPLVRGGLDIVLIGEELARKGIIDIGDSLQRDASVGARLYLTVTEGEAGELIKGNYGLRGNGTYLYNLINHNINRRELPATNLHMFVFDYFQEGQTPYLPVLKQISKESVTITGVALFDKDKMVKKIPAKDMFYFKLLVDKYAEGSHVIKMGKERNSGHIEKSVEASVTSLKSKSKIIVKHNTDPVEVSIQIKLKGIIREYTGKKLTPDKVSEVEKQMKKDIEKNCLKMLKQFQELGIDPVGIGQNQKHGIRGFDFKEWEDSIYPQVKFNVNAKVQILEAGTVE